MHARANAKGSGARSVGVVAVWAVTSLLARPVQAEVQLPAVNFKPAASTRSYIVTESGTTLPHLRPSASILFSYAHRPLDLINLQDDTRVAEVIRYQWNMDVLLAMGFFDFLELGVALPATLTQEANDLTEYGRGLASSLSGGLGDIRIIPKVAIRSKFAATLAVAAPFSVPSGAREQLLGDDGVTFSPRLIFTIESWGVGVSVNAGFLLRSQQDVELSKAQTLRVDDEVFWSLGIKLPLYTGAVGVELISDSFFSLSIYDQSIEQFPVEVLGGLRLRFPYGIIGNLGGGAGVTRGMGAPKFRIFWGIGYEYTPAKAERREKEVPAPAAPDDPDGDGIRGAADSCPTVAEDKDGFEDADGCPDPDNDKDGILDADDRCPDKPEDKDGFEDADGCPDPDNDKDGLLDTDDKCPDKPEDRDGFEDGDGCPDPDNDNDGILDTDDKCPAVAEDKDGYEDEDGCPDNDNDRDGVLDKDDRCPNQPEVFNGVKDDDGCPDRSRGPVQIQRGKITVPPVYFATNKDVILAKSYPVLRMVAKTLTDNPWVKRVRIEGHTDSRGADAFNLDLSDRRAASVRRFLVNGGVDPNRLESRGYGEAQPIASNSTKRGRALNRRVEFIIVDPPQARAPGAP